MDQVTDWHADWIIGLLSAIAFLGLLTVALLGSILGTLRRWEDQKRHHLRTDYPSVPPTGNPYEQ